MRYTEDMDLSSVSVQEYGLAGLSVGFSYLIIRDLIGVLKQRRNGNGSAQTEVVLRKIVVEERIVAAIENQTAILKKLSFKIERIESAICYSPDAPEH